MAFQSDLLSIYGEPPITVHIASAAGQRKNEDGVPSSFYAGMLYPLDLTGTQATRANVQGCMSAVYIRFYFSDIGLPLSVGLAIGMGNIVTEHNAFAAEFTLSHFSAPPLSFQRLL